MIEDQIRLIPKKKSIKENFAFGFSLVEFLLIGSIGLLLFVIFDNVDRYLAYRITFTITIIFAFMLIEVPTTQLRFGSILMKCFLYTLKRKELYFNPKKL